MAEKKSRPSVSGLSIMSNADNWQQLGKATDEAGGERLRDARLLPIELLRADPNQPRQNAGSEIAELAADVKARGIIQPLLVRPDPESVGHYVIVAGERRFRAAIAAELSHVPAMVREMSDDEARVTSLVENIQRSDLDPEDEARYFKALVDLGMSYRDIAAAIHKSHNYVGRRLRMLANPDHLLAYRQGLATLEGIAATAEDDSDFKSRQDAGTERTSINAEAPGTERTSDDEDDFGTERTSSAEEQTGTLRTSLSEELVRPYASRKAPLFRPRRSLYRPFHQTITIVRRMKPEEVPQEERDSLLRTVDSLMQELEELRRRMNA